jgi:hypothetical protein
MDRSGVKNGKSMKTIHIIAIVAAVGFVTSMAQAHDEALSPKAKEMRSEGLRGGTDVTQTFEFTRGNKAGVNRVAGMASKNERDLIREQRNIVYTGKTPLRDSQKQFEVAPVK